jgi:hypothetical protein
MDADEGAIARGANGTATAVLQRGLDSGPADPYPRVAYATTPRQDPIDGPRLR